MANKKPLVPYKTILEAKHGNSDAMKEILRYYEQYIDYNSYREIYDGLETRYIRVDDEIKARIQAKLMYKIITSFDPMKPPKKNNCLSYCKSALV